MALEYRAGRWSPTSFRDGGRRCNSQLTRHHYASAQVDTELYLPTSMSEIRRSERHLTLKTAKIVAANSAAAIDCAILNISEHGACILVPEGATVAGSFELFIDHDGSAHHCQLAWRQGTKIGVSFEALAPLQSVVECDRERTKTQGGSRPPRDGISGTDHGN